jgi:hypothetical protein
MLKNQYDNVFAAFTPTLMRSCVLNLLQWLFSALLQICSYCKNNEMREFLATMHYEFVANFQWSSLVDQTNVLLYAFSQFKA